MWYKKRRSAGWILGIEGRCFGRKLRSEVHIRENIRFLVVSQRKVQLEFGS